MEKNDYYEVLGVTKSSSDAEIKKAYRTKARKHHPDVDKAEGADNKFKEINEAYQVLSDPQKKSAYDQYGHSAFQQGGGFGGAQAGGADPFGGAGGYQTYSWSGGGGQGGAGGFADPFDIFEAFFGGQSPFGNQQARLPRYAISIDFMDAVHGLEKEIDIEGKKQKIKIPAGVDDGSEIRFSNFILVCQVGSNPQFKRRGYDIISEHEISYSKAALGSIEKIETIDGVVKIKVPSGTQPGTQIRLRGKGIKHVSGRGTGDHYAILRIIIPSKLSNEQKKLLEQLENS